MNAESDCTDAAKADRPWVRLYERQVVSAGPCPDDNMIAIFQRALGRNPHALAVRYFDGVLSYSALDSMSDALAAWLELQDVSAGDRVAVVLQNVPHFLILSLAAWKRGAAVLPLNPMYGEEELARLFADAEPKVVLCEHGRRDVVAAALARVGVGAAILGATPSDFQTRNDDRVFKTTEGEPSQAPDLSEILRRFAGQQAPPQPAGSSDLALLMYTSGTTGRPKGVMLRHGNLAFGSRTTALWADLAADDIILGIAPLFHIIGFVCHLGACFYAGCTLLLSYRMIPDVVLDLIRESRPTYTVGAITAFNALMNTPGASADDFACFRKVVSGGAPIPPAVREALRARIGLDIYPGYGMTETSAPTHYAPFNAQVPIDPASGALAVGIPVGETEVRIVDDAGETVGTGQPGEVWLRGPQIMAGYWRLPEDTSEALVDGWMRTGDVGVMDDEGWLYLVDRKKDMIIASGFKVWPREVEDWLYTHPAVREAAVVGTPDPYRGESVLAYVSLSPSALADAEDLIAHCRQGLAAYKCPRRVVILADLPKTVTGKIQRNVLRTEAQNLDSEAAQA